jgi:hypothetical protein
LDQRENPKATKGRSGRHGCIKGTKIEQQLPAELARLVNSAQLPQLYETAKNALAECEKLDECAGWADKAAAIASYARQADNPELENYARRIRARAVRRCGELLGNFDARGGDRSKTVAPLAFASPSRSMVAQEAGLSKHKARAAVNIAAIPEPEFEALVESKRPPGTALLAQLKKMWPRERVRSVTERSLSEVLRSEHAGRAVEALLQFERSANECGFDVIVEILRRHGQKLERVRRGIGLAFRLNAALEDSGLRGIPMLRQVPEPQA